jgi:hypothetical protein
MLDHSENRLRGIGLYKALSFIARHSWRKDNSYQDCSNSRYSVSVG